MSIKIIHEDYSLLESGSTYSNVVQRYFLRRTHPRKIILDTIGSIWACYFLWNQNASAALLVYVAFALVGVFATRNVDLELMSQTTLGRLGLLHAQPINLFITAIGLIPFVVGFWGRLTELTLIGFSIVLLGHFYGWEDVHSSLRVN